MTFQLYVADSGLKELSGHHIGAMHTLVSTLGPERAVFYCHRDPAEQLLAEGRRLGTRLRPFFSVSYYAAFNARGTLVELNDYINSLAREYIRLFEEVADDDPAALLLHHTLDWPHLQALGVAVARSGGSGCGRLQHLVLLMFSPGLNYDLDVSDQRRYLSYRMAVGRLWYQPNVRLFAASRDHASAFARILPEGVELPVHPCFFFRPVQPRAESPSEPSDLRSCLRGGTITLYLGHARDEKGFCDLPHLVSLLALRLDDTAEILIHFDLNPDLTPPSAALLSALGELRTLAAADRRIRLFEAFLSDQELADIIAKSALIVFNYDPGVYAFRSSGLLWQACSSDVPVMIIGDSWLSREAKRLSRCVFAFSDLPDVANALLGGARIESDGAYDPDYRGELFESLDDFFDRQWIELSGGKAQDAMPAANPKRFNQSRKALMVDAEVPDPRTSGGGYAAAQEIRMLQALRFGVAFSSPSGFALDERVSRLIDQGVDMLYRPRYYDTLQVLLERGSEFDLVYVTRFHVAQPIIDAIRSFAPQAKLVLNVADLHFLRELRKAKVTGDEHSLNVAETIREQELKVLSQVDLVLTYTDVELAVIESHLGGRVPVARCPWVEDVLAEAAPYEARRDIAFLGGYSHSPNVDAVLWFVEHVMPRLREALPGVRFRVYGANVPPEVQGCAAEDVIIEGFVTDVSELYDSCRVFVAPLRYGAGLKAKIAAALARGVPCVLSPVAAEGLFAGSSTAAAVVQTPEEWAAAIAAMYGDRAAWTAASRAALDYGVRHFRFEDAVQRMAKVWDQVSH
jgi:glycosyltransferase involved in cell wall biosynthesis